MHLKREKAPNKWPIARKRLVWTITPRPGPHKKSACLPLGMIIRDSLKIADKLGEVKTLIHTNGVLVDGKPAKDYAFPVGIMDVLTFKETQDNYRMLPSQEGITPKEIPPESAGKKLRKITKITTLPKGKTQYGFHDGRTIISDQRYKIGDTLEFDLSEGKVIGRKEFKEGEEAIITEGNKAGLSGKIEKIAGKKANIKWGAIPYRKNEIFDSKADIGRAKKLLNWEPKTSLEDGLCNTVNWYKEKILNE